MANLHAVAMIASGGVLALFVHDWVVLNFLFQTWFNLDIVWALSLVLVGAAGLLFALVG
ncbi:MAG: hypothetical protein ACR2PG_11175 [Hyphomicrobiaceae bacterium]